MMSWLGFGFMLPAAAGYSCPPNSYLKAGPPADFSGCTCNYGYDRGADECVEGFKCPSSAWAKKSPPNSISDCVCMSGYQVSGNTCAKIPPTPVPTPTVTLPLWSAPTIELSCDETFTIPAPAPLIEEAASTSTQVGALAIVDRWTNKNMSCVVDGKGCFDQFLSATTDDTTGSLYLATDEVPVSIVKLDKLSLSYQAHTTLRESESTVYGLALSSTHLYAVTYSPPATVIRLDRETLVRDDTLVLEATDQYVSSMRLDEARGFLYLGALLRLLKVKLSAVAGDGTGVEAGRMARVGGTAALPGEGTGTGGNRSGIVGSFEADATSSYLYAVPYASSAPSQLLRVQASDMSLVGQQALPSVHSVFASASNDEHLFFATATAETAEAGGGECCAKLVRVRKAVFDAGTDMGALTKGCGVAAAPAACYVFLEVPEVQSASIDERYLYFSVLSSRVAAQQTKVRLSDLTTVSTAGLDAAAGEGNIQAVAVDRDNLYLALYTEPGRVVKLMKNGFYSWRSDSDHSQCVQSRPVYCTDDQAKKQCRYDTFECAGFAPTASRACHLPCTISCQALYHRRSCVRANVCGACLPPYQHSLSMGNVACVLPSSSTAAATATYGAGDGAVAADYCGAYDQCIPLPDPSDATAPPSYPSAWAGAAGASLQPPSAVAVRVQMAMGVDGSFVRSTSYYATAGCPAQDLLPAVGAKVGSGSGAPTGYYSNEQGVLLVSPGALASHSLATWDLSASGRRYSLIQYDQYDRELCHSPTQSTSEAQQQQQEAVAASGGAVAQVCLKQKTPTPTPGSSGSTCTTSLECGSYTRGCYALTLNAATKQVAYVTASRSLFPNGSFVDEADYHSAPDCAASSRVARMVSGGRAVRVGVHVSASSLAAVRDGATTAEQQQQSLPFAADAQVQVLRTELRVMYRRLTPLGNGSDWATFVDKYLCYCTDDDFSAYQQGEPRDLMACDDQSNVNKGLRLRCDSAPGELEGSVFDKSSGVPWRQYVRVQMRQLSAGESGTGAALQYLCEISKPSGSTAVASAGYADETFFANEQLPTSCYLKGSVACDKLTAAAPPSSGGSGSAPELHWRSDLRCGVEFPADNGQPAQCNPQSSTAYCCNHASGYCGSSSGHCQCGNCTNYNPPTTDEAKCESWLVDPPCWEPCAAYAAATSAEARESALLQCIGANRCWDKTGLLCSGLPHWQQDDCAKRSKAYPKSCPLYLCSAGSREVNGAYYSAIVTGDDVPAKVRQYERPRYLHQVNQAVGLTIALSLEPGADYDSTGNLQWTLRSSDGATGTSDGDKATHLYYTKAGFDFSKTGDPQHLVPSGLGWTAGTYGLQPTASMQLQQQCSGQWWADEQWGPCQTNSRCYNPMGQVVADSECQSRGVLPPPKYSSCTSDFTAALADPTAAELSFLTFYVSSFYLDFHPADSSSAGVAAFESFLLWLTDTSASALPLLQHAVAKALSVGVLVRPDAVGVITYAPRLKALGGGASASLLSKALQRSGNVQAKAQWLADSVEAAVDEASASGTGTGTEAAASWGSGWESGVRVRVEVGTAGYYSNDQHVEAEAAMLLIRATPGVGSTFCCADSSDLVREIRSVVGSNSSGSSGSTRQLSEGSLRGRIPTSSLAGGGGHRQLQSAVDGSAVSMQVFGTSSRQLTKIEVGAVSASLTAGSTAVSSSGIESITNTGPSSDTDLALLCQVAGVFQSIDYISDSVLSSSGSATTGAPTPTPAGHCPPCSTAQCQTASCTGGFAPYECTSGGSSGSCSASPIFWPQQAYACGQCCDTGACELSREQAAAAGPSSTLVLSIGSETVSMANLRSGDGDGGDDALECAIFSVSASTHQGHCGVQLQLSCGPSACAMCLGVYREAEDLLVARYTPGETCRVRTSGAAAVGAATRLPSGHAQCAASFPALEVKGEVGTNSLDISSHLYGRVMQPLLSGATGGGGASKTGGSSSAKDAQLAALVPACAGKGWDEGAADNLALDCKLGADSQAGGGSDTAVAVAASLVAAASLALLWFAASWSRARRRHVSAAGRWGRGAPGAPGAPAALAFAKKQPVSPAGADGKAAAETGGSAGGRMAALRNFLGAGINRKASRDEGFKAVRVEGAKSPSFFSLQSKKSDSPVSFANPAMSNAPSEISSPKAMGGGLAKPDQPEERVDYF